MDFTHEQRSQKNNDKSTFFTFKLWYGVWRADSWSFTEDVQLGKSQGDSIVLTDLIYLEKYQPKKKLQFIYKGAFKLQVGVSLRNFPTLLISYKLS